MTAAHRAPGRGGQPWTPKRLAALRALADDWLALIGRDDLGFDEHIGMDIMAGAIIGFVPELLDEVDRLRAGGAPP